MMRSIVARIGSFLRTDWKNDLKADHAVFAKECLESNIQRQRVIFILLFYCNLLLLLFDRVYYFRFWNVAPAYLRLFYSHLFMLVILPIFIYAASPKRVQASLHSLSIRRFIFQSGTMLILFWCVFLAVNAQYIHGQISAYIICAFSISSIFILTPIESFVIYASSFITFTVGLSFVQHNTAKLSGNLINASILIILAFIISRIMLFYHLRYFIDKKIIEKKTEQLNSFNHQLESIIWERTDELVTANERLIDEMEIRHQAELEAAAARYIYDEKERELHRLMELENLRTNFFSNISHELKTPINVILSAEQLVSLKLKTMLAPRDYHNITGQIGIIRQNCYRLIRLVSNLIDITKIDAGYFQLHLHNHDIVSVVEEIVQSVVPFVERNRIGIVFDTEIEEKIIACDADKIERVMLNLLSNAIKFTPTDGTITVSIMDGSDYIAISVKDTGAGIPAHFQSSIFDRFVQADNSLSRNAEGSGIGLSIVKSIVEMHQGSISVTSTPGSGSEFVIQLPYTVLPENTMECPKESLSADRRVERIQVEFSDVYHSSVHSYK